MRRGSRTVPHRRRPCARAVRLVRAPIASLGLAALAALAAGCARGSGTTRAAAPVSQGYTAASPLRLGVDRLVPRGGGTYKIGAPYQVGGVWFVPREDPAYERTGVASWYGRDFHGRRTANGEYYDMRALTAAHPTLPIPSYAYVTNLANGRTLMVRINDRGPYVGGRLIDLSLRAAELLGFAAQGTASVRVRYAGRAPLDGDEARETAFLLAQPWSRSAMVAPARGGTIQR